MTGTVKRRYHSSIRRGDAPTAVLHAAAGLFAAHGYHAVSIEDIAAAAGVARPTVYAAVGSKTEIFSTLLMRAITDSQEPGEAEDQDWFLDSLGQPSAAALIARHAHNVRRIGERVVRLYWAAEIAATTDETIAELWAQAEAGRLRSSRIVATELLRRPEAGQEYDVEAAADLIYAILSPATYRALVLDRGWEPDRFEAWATRTLQCSLLRPESAR